MRLVYGAWHTAYIDHRLNQTRRAWVDRKGIRLRRYAKKMLRIQQQKGR